MSTIEVFLIAMLIIFSLPYLVWRLLNRDDVAPLVVVQILAGIVLGPGVLGALLPEHYAFVFRPAVVQSLNGIAWWAVILFVWIAGIELDRHTGGTGARAASRPGWRWHATAVRVPRPSCGNDGWAGPGRAPAVVVGWAWLAPQALPILILLAKMHIQRQYPALRQFL
jgi:hypothetical protein